MNPVWISIARTYIGLREIPGPKHDKTIQGWLHKLKAWWSDDETAWCGAFVGAMLDAANQPIIKSWYRAKDWANYGQATQPRLGAILVFGREGGGHVGFYVGEGTIKIKGKPVPAFRVLGGNQSNMVCETWIAKSRLLACRWPAADRTTTVPVFLTGNGQLSRNEA